MNIARKPSASVVAFAIGAALAACAHQNQSSAPPQTTAEVPGASASRCPIARLNGVNASVADNPDGLSITFTGPETIVDEVRANVHAMDEAITNGRDPFAVCACALPYRKDGATEAMPESSNPEGRWNESGFGPSGPPGPPPSNNATAPGQPEPSPFAYDVNVRSSVEETATGAVLKLVANDAANVQTLRDRARLDARAMQAGCMGTPRRP